LIAIAPYSGHKVLILSGIGHDTEVYANQLSELFKKAHWEVCGPRPAPDDQNVVNVQISMQNLISTTRDVHPEVTDITNAFNDAGIRHRLNNGVLDANIPSGWIVLWVGAAAPEGQPDTIPLQIPSDTFSGWRCRVFGFCC
jgi:hypothetical protein